MKRSLLRFLTGVCLVAGFANVSLSFAPAQTSEGAAPEPAAQQVEPAPDQLVAVALLPQR